MQYSAMSQASSFEALHMVVLLAYPQVFVQQRSVVGSQTAPSRNLQAVDQGSSVRIDIRAATHSRLTAGIAARRILGGARVAIFAVLDDSVCKSVQVIGCLLGLETITYCRTTPEIISVQRVRYQPLQRICTTFYTTHLL